MRIIFAGTPEPAVVALEKLLASSHEVVAVSYTHLTLPTICSV